jgi:hypothetical protein
MPRRSLLATRARPPRWLLVLLVPFAVATIGASAAVAAPRQAPAEPTGTGTAGTATTVAVAEQGPVAGGGNTPQPVGRPAPPRGQRIADSLIWLWVMALLAGGCLLAFFVGRRSSGGLAPGPAENAPGERETPVPPSVGGRPGK